MPIETSRALIGHTGFVGSTLLRAGAYDALFNSRNIDDIKGKHFGTVVCAGVSAVKWLANKEPAKDWDGISSLIGAVERVTADRFILISTVDVYPKPLGVKETDAPDMASAEPYGKHRRALEDWVTARFDNVLVVRLPALFGEGLKKNVIFDLMNDNQTEKINPNGCFQWYPMRRFAQDLERLDASGETLVNIAVEPLATRDIVARFFPKTRIGSADMPALRYDMKTCFPELLGGQGDYHLSRQDVMNEFELFLSGADS